MKHYLSLMMLVVLMASCFSSCTKQVPITRITGDVQNFEGGGFSMKAKYFDLELLQEKIILIEAPIDSTGHFEVETQLIVADVWHVVTTIGNEIATMSISPGDDLYIALDSKHFDETITFSGRGAEKNNFKAWTFMDRELSGNKDGGEAEYKLNFEDFISKIQSKREKMVSVLDSIYGDSVKDAYYQDYLITAQNDLVPQIIKYVEYNSFVDYDKAKDMLATIGENDKDMLFQYGWHRKFILSYANFMAGTNSSDKDVYETANNILTGNALRYFYKEGAEKLVIGEDGERIIADIKANEANNEFAPALIKTYERISMVKTNYPDSAGDCLFFEYLKER